MKRFILALILVMLFSIDSLAVENNTERMRVTIIFEQKPSSLDLGGLEIIHEFDSIPAVTAYVSNKEFKMIENRDNVEKIIIDKKVNAFRASSLPVIRLNEANLLGFNGTGVNISIIDTGVFNHSEFIDPNRLLSNQKCYCYPDCCPNNAAIDDNAADDQSHGTHCAGIAAGELGIANGSSIIAVKVLDSSGEGYDSDVAKGVEWAFLNGANVISLSLGDDGGDCYDILTTRMIENAVKNNTVVVAAAGNNGPGSNTIARPACAKGAIAVGSTNDNDVIVSTSSRGPTNDNRTKPDLTAPGVSVRSTINSLNGYQTKSGTSMAAPHVAGVAALLIQRYNETFGYFPEPARVKAILLTAVNTTGMQADGYEQRNNVYGSGRIDAYEALTIINFTNNNTISAGQTHKYNLNVTDDAKITLYWPEDQNTNNDLNLLVGNSTYNYSFVTDENDNVEQVFLYNASKGMWRIYVKAITASDQDYYIASNMEIFEDVTPPSLLLILPENRTYTNRTGIPLNFTTDGTNHTIWYTINGENETAITGNTTFNVSSDGSYNITLYVNDSYNNINKTTRFFSVDEVKPLITIISPSENQTFDSSLIWFNISLNEAGNVSLFSVDGGSNSSMTRLNTTYFYNLSSITEGEHNVTFFANDSGGWTNSSTVNFSVMVKPVISNPSVDKPLIAQNETINITSVITDENLDLVWVNVTKPDNSSVVKNMTNASTSFYAELNQTNQTGVYSIIVFANDTYANVQNTSLSFEVSQSINISINSTNGISAINVSIKILYNRTSIVKEESTNSSFDSTIPKGIWDVQLNTTDTNITLRDVNFTESILMRVEINDSISAGSVAENVQNLKAVVIELTNFSFSNANLTFLFDMSLVSDRTNLRVYRCEYWNFTVSSCNESWQEDSVDASFNATIHDNNVSLITSGFSGFSLGEIQATTTTTTTTTTVPSVSLGGGGIIITTTTMTTTMTTTTTTLLQTTTTTKLEKPLCGNNICETNEDCSSCLQDCACLSGYECKDGVCVEIFPEIEKPLYVRYWYVIPICSILIITVVSWKLVIKKRLERKIKEVEKIVQLINKSS